MSTSQLATLFRQYRAFQWDPHKGFVLASGATSPCYVDCRALLAHPDARWLVARLACAAIRDIPCEAVGGLEIGAIPLATAIILPDHAFAAQPSRVLRTFTVRKHAKEHGLGKRIEGMAAPNDRIIIVDDVLTSGASILHALQAAREANLRPTHALVIVDRQEQSGKHTVEAAGISLISLLTMDDLKPPPPTQGQVTTCPDT